MSVSHCKLEKPLHDLVFPSGRYLVLMNMDNYASESHPSIPEPLTLASLKCLCENHIQLNLVAKSQSLTMEKSLESSQSLANIY